MDEGLAAQVSAKKVTAALNVFRPSYNRNLLCGLPGSYHQI